MRDFAIRALPCSNGGVVCLSGTASGDKMNMVDVHIFVVRMLPYLSHP
jgi:hypothetical protein